MLKRAFLITSTLLIVIGSLLLWQWISYSNRIDDSIKESLENATQKISIEVEDSFLEVTQRIEGLESGKEYRVLAPPNAKEWSCMTVSEKSDSAEDGGSNRFLAKDGSLTFLYRIPTGRDDHPFLLNDWAGTIGDVSLIKTSIEIADLAKRQGTWIAGAPLKGVQELQHINYYVFEGEGITPSLYWHPYPLTQESTHNGKLSFFYEGKKSISLSLPNIERLVDVSYAAIVLTNQLPEASGSGLMVIDSSTVAKELERKLVDYYFYGKFENLPVKERWLIDVLSSLLLGEDSKHEKGDQLIHELKRVFTNEEVKEFVDLIIHDNGVLSVEKLDEIIGKIRGKNTRFFALNKDVSRPFISLYFFDPRSVYVEGKWQKDIEVLYFAEERYFPAIETFEALEYNVKVLSDKKTLLLSKKSNTYRFYEDQNIFIYNEEDYGLLERPLRVFNGEIYVKEKWLITLFHVLIHEDTDMIKLMM